MMRIWITVNTAADTALAVVGLGVAAYAVSAKPGGALLYYGVALICILCAVVGFCNLPVLHAAARQQEEKNARQREERDRAKAQKEAARAEEAPAVPAVHVPEPEEAPAAPEKAPDSPCQE